MPGLLRNALAVFAGTAIGGSVNMALIVLGPSIIAPPAWFVVLDLSAAYLPMSWIGLRIGMRMKQGNAGAVEPS